MYAAILPDFQGQKAAGARAGAHCRARRAECGRTSCVLHAAGVQAGRDHDDSRGRGLWRRNGILSWRDDDAGLEYALFASSEDAVADVRYGVNRLAGRCLVPQGRSAARAAEPLYLRRDRVHDHLRRHYESRVCAHVVEHDQLENHFKLLRHRPSGRSGARHCHVFLPVVDCRTHARKARPDQDQIRLGRVSSFVEMPFGLQRYTIAKAKPSNTFSVSVMLCLPSFLCPDAKRP